MVHLFQGRLYLSTDNETMVWRLDENNIRIVNRDEELAKYFIIDLCLVSLKNREQKILVCA